MLPVNGQWTKRIVVNSFRKRGTERKTALVVNISSLLAIRLIQELKM